MIIWSGGNNRSVLLMGIIWPNFDVLGRERRSMMTPAFQGQFRWNQYEFFMDRRIRTKKIVGRSLANWVEWRRLREEEEKASLLAFVKVELLGVVCAPDRDLVMSYLLGAPTFLGCTSIPGYTHIFENSKEVKGRAILGSIRFVS